MSSANTIPPPMDSDHQPSVEERRALIERLAASEQFRRSARLRDFLLYVGRQSLIEGCPELHENEIAINVFGRNSSFLRSEDSIVRVNATEMRKRIELYFENEGAHEPLVLEIPRGAYKPVFRWRIRGKIEEPSPTEESITPNHGQEIEFASTVKKSPHFAALVFLGAISVSLAIVSIILFQQNRTLRNTAISWESKPALKAFWGNFLRNGQSTDIVLPDDTESLISDIAYRPFTLDDYVSRAYLGEIQSSSLSADRKADITEISTHNLITFGGLLAAQQIRDLIRTSGYSPDVSMARLYRADSIKRDNVILIGGKKANPWVYLFDDETNFTTDFDRENGHPFIGNIHPKPGESTRYIAADNMGGYCAIAFLPNPAHTGNVVILAGTHSDATEAAAEFLTSEEQMERFLNIIHLKKFPYFEILLKTSRLNGTSLGAELIAYRTYPDLH